MSKRVVRIIAPVLGISLALIAAEILFRFLPVRQSGRTVPVSANTPVIHYQENHSFRFSKGWDFSIQQLKRSNNYGFLSDVSYDRENPAPLLGVIGDSYVEAAQVPNSEGIAGRLAMRAQGIGKRAYGFGYSGSSLAQYLAFAEFARKEFRPAGLVVVVVGNDFDESLRWYKAEAGFHYFNRDERGKLFLERVDWAGRSFVSNCIESSALGMYLLGNLGLRERLKRGRGRPATQFAGNVPFAVDPKREEDSKEAVDEFLHRLPEMSELSPGSILFLVDGLRPQLYDPVQLEDARGSFAGKMFAYFMESARASGFRIIDMEPIFIQHFKEHGQRFEFPDDAHWNALGHQVAFEAVLASGILETLGR